MQWYINGLPTGPFLPAGYFVMSMNVKMVMSSVTDKMGRISTLLNKVFVTQEEPSSTKYICGHIRLLID
jgi:hypothetical protein